MKVVARVPVGDGTSDIVADGDSLLVVCHRDHTLWRLDRRRTPRRSSPTSRATRPRPLTLPPVRSGRRGVAPTSSASTRRRGRRWRRSRPASAASSSPRSTARWVAVAEPEADRQGLPVLERLVPIDTESGERGNAVLPTEAVSVTGDGHLDGAAPLDRGRGWRQAHPRWLRTARPPLHCEPRGAIAQLGERLDRTQEVAGSSPASSMKAPNWGCRPDRGDGQVRVAGGGASGSGARRVQVGVRRGPRERSARLGRPR